MKYLKENIFYVLILLLIIMGTIFPKKSIDIIVATLLFFLSLYILFTLIKRLIETKKSKVINAELEKIGGITYALINDVKTNTTIKIQIGSVFLINRLEESHIKIILDEENLNNSKVGVEFDEITKSILFFLALIIFMLVGFILIKLNLY